MKGPTSESKSQLVGGPANPSRRQVLVTGGVVVAATALSAACGSSPSSGPATRTGTTIPTADVPVGGGEILAAEQVVVTQPKAGEFRAFTAVCTHQGCLVASIVGGLIQCPCHGSEYSIEDGSVKTGPAQAPLGTVPFKVSGSTITLT